MADVTVKKCDVFGTIKNVLPVTVVAKSGDTEYTFSGDLSMRGWKRLLKFLERATAPPAKAK